jgi:NAD(P)-dependent dehydrogenase (short-subunit alcohol dehydrogenase family)
VIDLSGNNIIITGASSGIGRACAVLANSLGANVVLVARDIDRLNQTADLLDVGSYLLLSKDLTNHNEYHDIVKESVNKFGRIDGMVHCAGIEQTIPLRMMRPKSYYDLFSLNVIAGFELARFITKKGNYVESNCSIVFVSSVMAELGQPGKIGYCSSKGALVSGARSMALELASKNIRVNCVLPGIVKTEMVENLFSSLTDDLVDSIIERHPLGVGEPVDVAKACIFLLSSSSKWITGSSLNIDGGYSAK